MSYSILIVLIVTIYIFILIERTRKYKYSVTKDYIYNFDKNLISEISLNHHIVLPSECQEYDSLFLKVHISSSFLSYLFKPYIKINNIEHYFEYGAKGIRYLNISHTKNQNITVIPKNLTFSTNSAIIYGYKNHINLSEKMLILAPHADDAEIAAFGLYKTAKNVTIVTTTSAESGECNYCYIYKDDKIKQALKKAELRAFDALCVPLLGNVSIEHSLLLGYFGGTPQWMREHPNEVASSNIRGIKTMDNFRKVSHANIILPRHVQPKQDSFSNDLKEIIEQLKPDMIVTPHPAIDSHSDHKYTTHTLIDILQSTKHKCKLLLYTNHLKQSETYPIGEMHSSITLPPNEKDFYFDSLYSFGLDKDLQIDKFFALESIHDLRDSFLVISIKRSFKHLSKMIRRKIRGKDKSYYKRAVRANELFFVVKSENIGKLLDI